MEKASIGKEVRSENLLSVDELKHGECMVVTEWHGVVRRFKGSYDAKANVVFFMIPWRYTILGYEQEDVDRV
ncbi:hypothetical protein [Bacillus phage vB_BceS-M2]